MSDSDRNTLVTLETGGLDKDKKPAPARRLLLPWGKNTFSVSSLNANGNKILRRSLDWAGGSWKGLLPGIAVWDKLDILNGGTVDGFDSTISNNLLFVVLDATTLTAQDQAKKHLIESWGYAVTPIEATVTQAEFDAAVAANSVAYISEEIHSDDLGTKLKDAPLGIVCEEGYSNDEFGISSDRVGYLDSQVDIVNSHYITAPFSTGALTITISPTDLQSTSGTLAT